MQKEKKENQHKVTEEDISPYLQPKFHSIGWRLFVYFFFISLIPIFIVGFSMIKNAEYSLETEINNKFESIASSKITKLNLIIQDAQAEFGKLTANHPELIDGFDEMIKASDFKKRDEIRKKLSHLQSSSKYFTELDFIYPKDGKVIVSTNRINEGKNIGDEQYFKKAKKQLTVNPFRYDYSLEQHILKMAMPLDKNKSLVTVLVGEVDLTPINKLLTENVGLGATGETYLVDKSRRIIAGIGNSDYYKKSDSNKRQAEIVKYKHTPVFTEGVTNGLKGKEGTSTYNNYTNNEVIGYFKYIPGLEIAFLAEQFSDEALAPIHKMKINFGWILLIVLAMDVCLSFIVANRITRPLARLTDKARLISKGDYEALAEVSSYDEFGILAQAFNKMSEALVLSLDETKNIIEVLPSALFILNVDGKIRSVNRTACELTEYDKETLLEMYFDDLLDHFGQDDEMDGEFNLKKLEKEGTIANIQKTFFTKSHYFLPVSISGTVLKDKKNKVIGFVVVIDDLSQIKESEYKLQSSHEKLKMAKAKTEEEKAKAEVLLESIGDGIIALDLKGNVMTMNQKSQEIFGKPLEEVAGRHYTQSFHFEDEKGRIVESNIFSVPGSIKMDRKIVFFIRPDNKKLPFSITVSPILFEGKSIGNIVTLRDITKEMEVDKAKSEFVSLASHQLRTPLTGIKWLLQEIMRKKNLDDTQMEYIEDAAESNDRMINLVNDLLNVSRLETGTIKAVSKKVNLFEFLNPIIKEAVCLAKEKNQKIKFHMEDPQITAILDAQLIGQVITNLLSNAIYYTDKNKSITISVEKNKKKVFIKIRDEGIGISKEDRKKLFKKFFRTKEASKRSTTGSGLGLYIVGKILEVCSGTIECVSEESKGTTFIVALPLKGPVNKMSEKTLILKKLFTPLKK